MADYWVGINIKEAGEFIGDNVKIRYGGAQSSDYNYIALRISGEVNFTNSEISNSYGRGICVNKANTTGLTLNNNTITENKGTGISMDQYGTGDLSIKGNSISNNAGLPIYIYLPALKSSIFAGIQNNNYTNNIVDGINFDGMNLNGSPTIDMTLSKNKYYIYNQNKITVPSGVTLTIDPGVIIKSVSYQNTIEIQGKLEALGTKDDFIVFTTYKDAEYRGSGVRASYPSDYWSGINVSETGEFTGDYVRIRYGGATGNNSSTLSVMGKLNLKNSEVSNSYRYGINFNTSTNPVLLFNTFNKNTNGINNAKNSIIIDAKYNYWGSSYGPSLYDPISGKWYGEGDKVSAGIDYFPWLGSELRYQFHFGQSGMNPATGNFSRTYTDLSMDSPGYDIDFSRTYNSRSDKTSVFGRGWVFSYESSVKDSLYNADTKEVRLPDGSVQTFKMNSDGTFTANDSHNTLVKNSDGTYTLTSKTQDVFCFNSNGHLVKIQDKNGNCTNISVDSDGRV